MAGISRMWLGSAGCGCEQQDAAGISRVWLGKTVRDLLGKNKWIGFDGFLTALCSFFKTAFKWRLVVDKNLWIL